MRSIGVAIIVACAVFTGGCASVKKKALRAEIATLQERVATQQARIESYTISVGTSQAGLDTRISYNPIKDWAQAFNARPAAHRTISFQQNVNGKIAKDDWDCGLFGSGGYFVEFNTSTSTRASLEIKSLTFVGSSGAIHLTAPMAFDFDSKLHGHLDPCIGGGKGWRPNVEADKTWSTVLGLQFGAVRDGKIPYALRLISPNDLSVTVQVDLGSIGTLGHPITATGLARELINGELVMMFDQEGEIGPLPDGTRRRYKIRTANPSFQADGDGLQVGTDVAIEILPN